MTSSSLLWGWLLLIGTLGPLMSYTVCEGWTTCWKYQLVASTPMESLQSFPKVLGAGSFYKVVGQRGDHILCFCQTGIGQNRGKRIRKTFLDLSPLWLWVPATWKGGNLVQLVGRGCARFCWICVYTWIQRWWFLRFHCKTPLWGSWVTSPEKIRTRNQHSPKKSLLWGNGNAISGSWHWISRSVRKKRVWEKPNHLGLLWGRWKKMCPEQDFGLCKQREERMGEMWKGQNKKVLKQPQCVDKREMLTTVNHSITGFVMGRWSRGGSTLQRCRTPRKLRWGLLSSDAANIPQV